MVFTKSKAGFIITITVVTLLLWWLKFHFLQSEIGIEAYWFNASYGLIALLGGVNGIFIAKRWGGLKSLIGRALTFISLALISECLAVWVWSFYNIFLQVEVPYPSYADLFYISVIPLLSLAMVNLAYSAGAKLSLKNLGSKIYTFAIPIILLTLAYILFLRTGVEAEDKLQLLLTYAYPLGYAITGSIALLTFLLTAKYLGGIMRAPVLWVLIAYSLLFFSDSSFLYTNLLGTYKNGDWVDLMYMFALGALSFSLINFDTTLKSIRVQMVSKSKGVELPTGVENAPDYDTYREIILMMIKDQERIIGPLALEEATNINGLDFGASMDDVIIKRNPKDIVNDLIDRYRNLFGKSSMELMKESVDKVLVSEKVGDVGKASLDIKLQ